MTLSLFLLSLSAALTPRTWTEIAYLRLINMLQLHHHTPVPSGVKDGVALFVAQVYREKAGNPTGDSNPLRFDRWTRVMSGKVRRIAGEGNREVGGKALYLHRILRPKYDRFV